MLAVRGTLSAYVGVEVIRECRLYPRTSPERARLRHLCEFFIASWNNNPPHPSCGGLLFQLL